MIKKIMRKISIWILLLGVSLTLVNCQKDDEVVKAVVHQKRSSNFNITKIDKSVILKNKALFAKLKKLKGKQLDNVQNKEVISSEHGFTINTDYGKYIESQDGSYKSYTFPVKREEETEELENLTVSLQEEGS